MTIKALTLLEEEDKSFKKSVRQFAETAIRPHVMEMDRKAEMSPAVIEKLFEQGLMGLEIPSQYGGRAVPYFQSILAIEELARVDPAVSVCVDVQNVLVNHMLTRWGSAEQKQRYLPMLATNTVGAFSLSEKEAGSDAFNMSARATLDGDYYVINARKHWTTNGGEAGLFIVFANTTPGKIHGVTAFLLERSTPGLTVGKREDKLGIRASSTCELVLENVRVPRDRVLGMVGGGYDIAVEGLNKGRIGIAAQMVGLAQGALEAAVAYAKKRKQFGETISSFQGVQFALAEMAVDVETARLVTYNAARLLEGKAPLPMLIASSSKAKYHASVVAERVASQAVEIFGGNGFTKDFPVEKYYRDAKIGKIYEGTSNIQLRTIAAGLINSIEL